eukprot:TRINITY_DN5282_c0_g3_i3.p1 TRINITY_DN5282_c0_g3~~TRINITY_DN5282_c0_g3_i3.p1  ORF type:complete len:492 (+),score=78.82 TRINITY_DN5282_c0_g3_i3:37-1512(+)
MLRVDLSLICFLLLAAGLVQGRHVVREHCGDTPKCIETSSFSYTSLFSQRTLDQRIEDLNFWMKKVGAQVKLEIRPTEDKGLGVFALEDIKTGTTLLKASERLVFKRDAIGIRYFRDPNNEQISHFYEFPPLKITDERNQLIIALLYHLRHIDNSLFKEYLLSLPYNQTLAFLRFTDEDLDLLEGDEFLSSKLEGFKESLFDGYQALREVYESSLDVQQRASFLGSDTIPFGDYVWARYIVETRAWTYNGRRYLVPIADFFNLEPREVDFLKYHNVDKTGAATVSAERDFQSGEEVLESYGDNANWLYVAIHGFIPNLNPHECEEIPIITPDFFDQMSPSMRRIAFMLGMGFLHCVKREEWLYLRYGLYNSLLNMDDDEKKACAEQIEMSENQRELLELYLNNCPEKEWKETIIPSILMTISGRIQKYYDISRRIEEIPSDIQAKRPLLSVLKRYYADKIELLNGISRDLSQMDPATIYPRVRTHLERLPA